jgi:NhaP-type Na+/H+ or K+/H+ antiporter
MLEKLQQKWKVNLQQLILILLTFALGGSACGYLGRKILKFLQIDNDAIYIFAYILVITILWPLCVLIISIPFGQFPFFINYLKKIKKRILGQ